MTLQAEDFIWSQRYRPRTIAETILPEEIKKPFESFVQQGNVPNLLLTGPAGCGKTTAAMAMCDEIGADYMLINGSLNGGIDTLRNEIQTFASTVSFTGGRKIVIIDEADKLTGATQGALRQFFEEYSKNCGFILTCNFKQQIIEPLHSRCSVIQFKIPASSKPILAAQFMHRVEEILKKEQVTYDRASVAAVISKFFPDFRRTINELQRYAACGSIDSGILANIGDENFDKLLGLIREKKWQATRQWLGENVDSEPIALMRKFYDKAYNVVKPASIPTLVLLIAQYQYQSSFVADQEINTMAFLTQVMSDVEFQ